MVFAKDIMCHFSTDLSYLSCSAVYNRRRIKLMGEINVNFLGEVTINMMENSGVQNVHVNGNVVTDVYHCSHFFIFIRKILLSSQARNSLKLTGTWCIWKKSGILWHLGFRQLAHLICMCVKSWCSKLFGTKVKTTSKLWVNCC